MSCPAPGDRGGNPRGGPLFVRKVSGFNAPKANQAAFDTAIEDVADGREG